MNIKEQLKILINYSKNNKHQQVMEVCEKILKTNQNISEVYNFYGLALQGLQKHKEAINYFNKAFSLQPKDYSAANNLGNSYKFLFLNKLAYKCYEKSLKINPNHISALINFAILKTELNDHDGAIELFERALEVRSDINKIKILFSMSELYEQKGEIENSKKILNKILEIDNFNTAAHYTLSKYFNYKKENKHCHEMENLLKNENLNDNQIINLSFALGKAYEEKENYEKSFNFYKIANDKKRKLLSYNSNYFNNLKINLKNFFEEINISPVEKDHEKKIIFICGMPRSGTTLVDQIISSHKSVTSSGENFILSNIIENKFFKVLKNNKNKINNLILTEGQNINHYYHERLINLNINKNIITDKTVQNFISIGFIRSLFPNSKVVNCERNPEDICLSIYKNNFNSSFMNWSYSQQEIANFYNFYSDLMKFWDYKFPKEIYHIKYENILSNPSDEIKKLINFCDLSWDPECINFQNNKNPVKTASSVQVRKPLYSSSKDLSKNYSKFMSTMFDSLRV